MSSADAPSKLEQQLREMNQALLVSSIKQHELTEQAQQAEAVARESEERYRALFDSAPMAVFVCDLNAVIQHYNAQAVELWGREPVCGVERHCGSTKLWLPDGEPLPHTQSPIVDVLRTGVPVHNVESSSTARRIACRSVKLAALKTQRGITARALRHRNQRAQALSGRSRAA